MSKLRQYRLNLRQNLQQQQPGPGLQETKTDRIYFKYAHNWSERSRLARAILPRCTRNPFHRAQCVHHAHYRISWLRAAIRWLFTRVWSRSVAGIEIVGWNIFPLCESCHGGGRRLKHGTCHQTKGRNPSWIRPDEDDQNFDHQTPSVLWELRIKFWVLVILYRVWPFALAIAFLLPIYAGYLLGANRCVITNPPVVKGKAFGAKPGKSGMPNKRVPKTLLHRSK